MSTVSRHAERLARQKMKEARRKNPSQVRGQLSIEKAKDLEFNRRVARGEIGFRAPKQVEELLPTADDIPDIKEEQQVSFLLQKKCLACNSINKYIATECRKCGGHFCYDKT
jgi:ribosomal protein L40E